LTTIVSSSASPARRRGVSDTVAAFAATLLFIGFHLASGVSLLTDGGGDNDSLMRLVEVRDLLAGQGWFDLTQYRMGLDGGFVMHWSRLVDAPIAAIAIVATAITGSPAMGELAALVLWPLLLAFCALFLLIRLTRSFAGEMAVLPAMVVGAAALHFVATFAPGALDHHNVQLVLILATVRLLAEAERDWRRSVGAGALAALMLAIGMESAPYVAVAGLWCAGSFLIRGERAGPMGFGIGFATTAAICFLATVPASHLSEAACDAFSLPQLSLAMIGGFGLALAAAIGGQSIWRRAALLALAGIAGGVVLHSFFPQCLGHPYGDVDTRLKTYWLNSIVEALPIWKIVFSRPTMLFAYYVTPLIAVIWLGVSMRRHGVRQIDLLVGLFLVAAMLVSFWQVRGAIFAIPLAVIPLAGWIARARAAAATGRNGAALRMVIVWLVSINTLWAGGAAYVAEVLGKPRQAAGGVATGECYSQADYVQLDSMPATTILAISNLGAAILRFTHHRAIAGSYHRNTAGNTLALDVFMGPPDGAAALLRGEGVTLVAYCPGNSESDALAGWAPDGLMAGLIAGKVPDWLEPVPGGADLQLYRVQPGS
jgi:hypothetical protein